MITKNPRKKVMYVSGTRADFGLMIPILKAIEKSDGLELEIYATGIHLMSEFGKTVNYVKKEFPRVKVIKADFKTDNRLSTVKFISKFIGNLINKLTHNRPDIVLVLGDRPEMLSVATTCLYLGVPVAHIHGGDKSGTVDETARHAITKLSHIHFAATKDSAERIRKMGEEKWRIHVVGAPALDTILNEQLPTKKEIYRQLNLDKNKKFILVTLHPISENVEKAGNQEKIVLAAVKKFRLPIVIIYPHADAGGRKIIKVIEEEKNNSLFHIFPSLNHKQFLALERETVVWVGNSSGAMIESSSFRTPVVNIGTRQSGRQRGNNVIDVDYDREQIETAIEKSLNDKKYLNSLAKIKNPWGDGKTTSRVAKILENIKIDSRLLTKQITY